jgi:hypothetical protein
VLGQRPAKVSRELRSEHLSFEIDGYDAFENEEETFYDVLFQLLSPPIYGIYYDAHKNVCHFIKYIRSLSEIVIALST